MWKLINSANPPINIKAQSNNPQERISRAGTAGRLIESGFENYSLLTNINDSTRAWNRIPQHIKDCSTIGALKSKVKSFVLTLPV